MQVMAIVLGPGIEYNIPQSQSEREHQQVFACG
jgi:hypothetical protein